MTASLTINYLIGLKFQLVGAVGALELRLVFRVDTATTTLVEISKHVIWGCLWCGIVILVLRVNVEAVWEEVKVEVFQIGAPVFSICCQLIPIQALEVVDGGAKIEIDLGKNVAITVLTDVLEGELLNDRLLTVEVTHVALQKHIP